MSWRPGRLLATFCLALVPAVLPAQGRGRPWPLHVIDDASRGADGVRLADANGDGLPDIATGWEEGGQVRAYLHPGHARAGERWPAVTVGKVASPEDAVLVDVDGDGAADVVSCCEGRTRSVFVHWAPRAKGRYLDPSAWKTEPFPALAGMQMWMFCVPLQLDGKHGIDLVLGSKGAGGSIGWLEAPASPRDLDGWKWHPLYRAGWIMSLVAADLDGDGDVDILASDRKGGRSGCLWLENPGPEKLAGPWKEHRIGPVGREVMFLDHADLDGDGLRDVVVAVRPHSLLWLRRRPGREPAWEEHAIPYPTGMGTAKSLQVGDIDRDGRADLVLTCENAQNASGVVWLAARKTGDALAWEAHEISGPRGVKFDLAALADVDGDGDLDVITTEERDRLGVIWYENPGKKR